VFSLIEFNEVSFGYDSQPVLHKVSFKVPIGEKHAIVGKTGAGKSTIAKLLLRYYLPWEGRILINGENLGVKQTRQFISYVPQEPYLFAGTIRENIEYGRIGASWSEIEQAAKIADAHDFIQKLPKGYETVLTEEGGGLSGGQRQRIALARAFIKDAPIFLWDEATSSLDTVSEQRIQTIVKSLKDKAVLTIAHRLDSIKEFDMIHVLSDGKIVESGKHEELLEKNGVYAALYRS
jgi:ABC-type multidrug transport system fused ATPase/permease subunit